MQTFNKEKKNNIPTECQLSHAQQADFYRPSLLACRPCCEHSALGYRMMASRSRQQAVGLGFWEASSLRSGCIAIHTTGSGRATLAFGEREPIDGFGGSAIGGAEASIEHALEVCQPLQKSRQAVELSP